MANINRYLSRSAVIDERSSALNMPTKTSEKGHYPIL